MSFSKCTNATSKSALFHAPLQTQRRHAPPVLPAAAAVQVPTPIHLCKPTKAAPSLSAVAAAQVLERRGVANDSDEDSPPANGRDAGAPPKSKSTSALVAAASGAGAPPRGGGLAAAAKAALRGVEPELYSPEELMGGSSRGGGDGADAGVGGGGAAGRPGLAGISAADAGGKGSWFANWFSSRGGAADDAASDSMLNRPPPVRQQLSVPVNAHSNLELMHGGSLGARL